MSLHRNHFNGPEFLLILYLQYPNYICSRRAETQNEHNTQDKSNKQGVTVVTP